MNEVLQNLPVACAVVGTILMAYLLIFLLVRYFTDAVAPMSALAKRITVQPQPPRSAPTGWKRVLAIVVIAFIASRAVIFLGSAWYANATGQMGYLDNLYAYWVKWDAPHYLGLIRNGYVNEGDAMYHIVFFPVYPLLCRLFLPLTFGNAAAAAFLVSNLSALAAGFLLYRLTEERAGARAAAFAVCFLFVGPTSFFLSLPYTESLFLLLTLGSVYCASRKRFAAAVALGAICCATRLMGVVTAIPVYFAMLEDARDRGRLTLRAAILRAIACCGMLVGVGAYLMLNWHVTGNPFQFWIYQRDHWYNTSGTLWNTFDYIVSYALSYDRYMQLGTWIPTCIAIFGAIALLIRNARRTSAGDAAYSWAYLYMTIIPTWLISGTRYVGGLYTLYPMLALDCKRRWVGAVLIVLSLVAAVYMACLFVFHSSVY